MDWNQETRKKEHPTSLNKCPGMVACGHAKITHLGDIWFNAPKTGSAKSKTARPPQVGFPSKTH
jgi:hypothetical protein